MYMYIYIHFNSKFIFHWFILQQCQSVKFDLLDSYRGSLFVILNECAQRVKDSNM